MTLPYLLHRSLKWEQLLKKAEYLSQKIPFAILKGQSLRRFKPRLMFKPYINVPRKMEKPIKAFGTLRGFMFSRGIQKRSAVSFNYLINHLIIRGRNWVFYHLLCYKFHLGIIKTSHQSKSDKKKINEVNIR